jgi:hypothetical protein
MAQGIEDLKVDDRGAAAFIEDLLAQTAGARHIALHLTQSCQRRLATNASITSASDSPV